MLLPQKYIQLPHHCNSGELEAHLLLSRTGQIILRVDVDYHYSHARNFCSTPR
jgi:hypothetical protein